MPRLGTVPDEITASTLSGGPQPGVEGAAMVNAASFDSAGGPTPAPLRMLRNG
jgi:hypothetical protein